MEKETQTAKPSSEICRIAKCLYEALAKDSVIDYSMRKKQYEFENILAYFIYYNYLPLSFGKITEDVDKLRIALKTLASAPWMGASSEKYAIPLKKLIDINLLVFNASHSGISMSLSLNRNCKYIPEELKSYIEKYVEKAESDHLNRVKLHTDLGFNSDSELLSNDIIKLINENDNQITIKIIAYHGRTWFGLDAAGGFLQDILNINKNLLIKLLLVDPDANIVVREGASREEHTRSSYSGLVGIQNLSKEDRKRIDMRFYGKKTNTAYLRGLFVENDEEKLIYAHITNWRFSFDRGTYGKDLELDRDSSLAKLCNQYFDDVFREAKPTWSWEKRIVYYIKKKRRIYFFVAIPLFLFWFSYIISNGNVNTILSFVFAFIFAVWELLAPIFNKTDS